MESKFLKKIIFVVFAIGLWHTACDAQQCPPPPSPSPDNPPTPSPTPPPSPDPVFVVSPAIFTAGGMKGAKNVSDEGAVLSADEQKIAKSLENCKDGMVAKKIAWEAWKSGISAQLQRHALMLARSLAGTTDDKQAMDFMLSALENPVMAQEKCFTMARGNGLEKKMAAEQLGILLQNPNLKERLK